MTMSKPMVLVFLLVILIITSQFEWKQQLVNDMEGNPSISQKQQHFSSREEVIKEKIILSQEKNIQKLNELVQTLQQHLLQCQGSNGPTDITGNSSTADRNEIKRQQILED
ncbi:uncharacterized protein M6B38_263640 [Iris pallida]|uniref:Uncharacterized protein n=1 Tax=Iris pallida TaxID=29817 RepID=A0AAX6EJI3_IRIPA|nr:uncharacterized protein M6B38_186910 [Iris pallida]KAJ6850495.1 uncharacterized protein M6B38_263640 [Iris pallida]